MRQDQFERTETGRMRIHVLPTDRFKTYAISLYIGYPLSEEEITPTALVPFVLRRGTERFPETKAFREQLDLLYGTGFGFDIYKRGNNHIVQLRMDTIDDRFAPSGTGNLLREALGLLGELVTRPAMEDGGFVSRYVEAEKQTVRKKLEAVINDKIKYAAERCTQLMFPQDPFRHHALGRLERFGDLNAQSLYAFYRKWLSEAQIDLYVVGNTTLDEVVDAVNEQFVLERGTARPYRFNPPEIRQGHEAQTIVEQLDVGQGKLNIGLLAPVLYADPRYPAMLMYNGILGGYPHSKLFMNVREKASLAYYASSRYDGFKGFVMIQSGIEIANYEKAVAIIGEQLEQMRQGRIDEVEVAQTRAMIANQLLETGDSPFATIAFDFNAALTGTRRSASELIEAVSAVTTEQIADVARQVQLDTIYFLRDRKGE